MNSIAKGALVATVIGCASGPALALPVSLEDTLSIVNVDLTANALIPSFTFDLNGDGTDDFGVEIETSNGLDRSSEKFGFALTELATIFSLSDTRNLFSGIFIQPFIQTFEIEQRFPGLDIPNARTFAPGEFVGGSDEDDLTSEQALLYARGNFGYPIAIATTDALLTNDGAIDDIDLRPDIEFGPFSETGTTAYVGLFVTDALENTNYGFAKLTRGSISISSIGHQTLNGIAAPIPSNTPSPVPLPAAGWLMLSGFAGLAALRRRRTKS